MAKYSPPTDSYGGHAWSAKWEDISDNSLLIGCESDETKLCEITDLAQAGNGLHYTGANAPFNTAYRLDYEFGITNWSSARCNYVNENMNSTNVCAVRGMRLPTYNETQISSSTSYNPCGGKGSTSGVPSIGGYTWTSTAFSNDSYYYWKWSGISSHNGGHYNASYRVRCVR